jgi:DNA-directed RNA polymerase specialized sigma24 family protein
VSAPAVPCPCALPIDALQAAFLELLPQVRAHAEFAFRFVRCEQARADCVAETVALAWKGFLALTRRDKDPGAFVTTFARRCAQAVRAGRRLAGQESGRDVLAPAARQGHGFTVGRFPDYATPYGGAWQESLVDNARSPVDEAAAFRLDFPCWLATLAERDRRLVEDMTLGHRTVDLARQFGLSAGRVSQLRRQYHTAWRRFHGELSDEPGGPGVAAG